MFLSPLSYRVHSPDFFDTVRVDFLDAATASAVFNGAAAQLINLRQLSPTSLTISFDETSKDFHVDELVAIFANNPGHLFSARKAVETTDLSLPAGLARTSEYASRNTQRPQITTQYTHTPTSLAPQYTTLPRMTIVSLPPHSGHTTQLHTIPQFLIESHSPGT
jgi:hypothetical protein